ncbi:MAG: hypothetical protein QOJ23_5209 [Actinomycetota bacterium]|jgi:hypothetical protein|nr:hypothetical protein [Actinomycetota bacterium]
MANDVSARELVRQVWDEVAAERALRPAPEASLSDYDRLVEDGERHYVNSRYVLDRAPLDPDRRPGIGGAGRLTAKLRARAARFVVGVLGGYFDDEQEFLAHLVRLQNTLTVHIDRLSGEIRQLEALLQAESERLRAADTALHARLEDRIRAVADEVAGLRRSGGGAER